METEIKLSPVLRHQADVIFEDDLMKDFPETTVSMNASYLDTEERDLGKHAFSFRRRVENGRTVYCLKGPRKGLSRLELESSTDDLPSAAAELCKSPEMPLEVGAILLSREFKTLCSSRFMRRNKRIRLGLSVIDISFDEGELENGGRFSAISELELELVSGSEEELLALSKILCEKYGLSVSDKTKARRAAGLTEEAFSHMRQVNPFFIASEMLNYCIKCGYVSYTVSEEDGKLSYYITEEGEKALRERFGIDPDKPCAKVK